MTVGTGNGADVPDLDELLAAWNNTGVRQAKLRILGPVTVTAYGPPPASAKSLCTEIVAYLWSRPNGVSAGHLAGDLWPHQSYTCRDAHPKNMASRVRQWLGTDPSSGIEYVPRSCRDGSHGYRLDGVLVDWDLFRRLRARGAARGADGLSDLIAALDLVEGRPWSQLRDFGYGWLSASDEPLYATAVVADVAHLVASRGFEVGNASAVARACEIALQLGETTGQGVS
jgi:hypothetical protein